MGGAEFELHTEPGIWFKRDATSVPIDLIVPKGVAPPGGRRGVRLPDHGKRATRHAAGLEAALIDASLMTIAGVDPEDPREIRARVAGEAALLISKRHKLHDRLNAPRSDRARDKDAGDVDRIMQTSRPDAVGQTMNRLLTEPIAADATSDGISYLKEQFGRRNDAGIEMAARALQTAVPEARLRAVSLAYIEQLEAALVR